MCKNHDQQHYSPLMRQAATSAALGGEKGRDLLLQVWTYHGLLDWMDRYGEDMSSLRQDKIKACIRREKASLQGLYDGVIQELASAWQEELLDPDLDGIPY